MNFNLQANKANLQMTLFSSFIMKAEKHLLHFKLICVACTPTKIKFQGSDSFEIAAINLTYRNNLFNIFNFFTNDSPVSFHNFNQQSNIVHLKKLYMNRKLLYLFQN